MEKILKEAELRAESGREQDLIILLFARVWNRIRECKELEVK